MEREKKRRIIAGQPPGLKVVERHIASLAFGQFSQSRRLAGLPWACQEHGCEIAGSLYDGPFNVSLYVAHETPRKRYGKKTCGFYFGTGPRWLAAWPAALAMARALFPASGKPWPCDAGISRGEGLPAMRRPDA
jgi:hypothetical protein